MIILNRFYFFLKISNRFTEKEKHSIKSGLNPESIYWRSIRRTKIRVFDFNNFWMNYVLIRFILIKGLIKSFRRSNKQFWSTWMPDTFCILPWIHMSITPCGFVRLCCQAWDMLWKPTHQCLYIHIGSMKYRIRNICATCVVKCSKGKR